MQIIQKIGKRERKDGIKRIEITARIERTDIIEE